MLDTDLQVSPTRPEKPSGYIDFYGFHMGSGGWLFVSWLAGRWADNQKPEILARFDFGEVSGHGTSSFFHRPDLDEGSFGLILFVPDSTEARGLLHALDIRLAGSLGWLQPADGILPLDDVTLTSRVKALLANADPGPGRQRLDELLSRCTFAGVDTTQTLTDFLRIGIDAAITCPPDAILLAGWILAEPRTVRAVRLRSGSRSADVLLEHSVRLDRPDVVTAFQASGLTDQRCGFLAYVAGAGAGREAYYLEIETIRGEIGFVPVPATRQRGMDAIRHLLGLFEVRYAEVDHAFDTVIGPAVKALSMARAVDAPSFSIAEFGVFDTNPSYSVIVPLFGRIDLMEYQLALFSRQEHAGHEFIYVLDDPDQERATRQLAESVYERFRIPFRLIMLDRNMGYAPANNIGLKMARGGIVCFMNSDVFPETDGWMPRLAAQLDKDPTLGAIGPLLLFEDGSVQHQGIVFEPVPQFGNWMFPHHMRKGWRPVIPGGLRRSQAITAACLVMRTELAREFNGFDEGFIIGDFEDTDLCLRMASRGLACAVDHDVRMIHLERRSQASSAVTWRMNLTLYNAWLHQRRWFGPFGLGVEPDEEVAILSGLRPDMRAGRLAR